MLVLRARVYSCMRQTNLKGRMCLIYLLARLLIGLFISLHVLNVSYLLWIICYTFKCGSCFVDKLYSVVFCLGRPCMVYKNACCFVVPLFVYVFPPDVCFVLYVTQFPLSLIWHFVLEMQIVSTDLASVMNLHSELWCYSGMHYYVEMSFKYFECYLVKFYRIKRNMEINI